MGSPESAFRKETRSQEYPWGIKLKSIPHRYDDAVYLLHQARRGVVFQFTEGNIEPINDKEYQTPKVVACREGYIDGVYKDDKNVVLQVYMKTSQTPKELEGKNSKPINYTELDEEALANDKTLTRYLLYDSDFGLNLSQLNDDQRRDLYQVLPSYLDDAFQDKRLQVAPTHKGVFLELV